MKTKRLFVVFIILFLFSLGFVGIAAAAAVEDSSRVVGSTPTGSWIVNETTFSTLLIAVLTDDGVFQYPLGFGCMNTIPVMGDALSYPNGTLLDPTNVAIRTGVGGFSDNGNGTHTFGITGATIEGSGYLGGYCSQGMYTFLFGYKDASCYGGNYLYVPYAAWQYQEPAAPAVPVCAFSANPSTGSRPLTVEFSDLSLNSPTSWNWIIQENNTAADTTTSVLQNVIATLNNPGNYDVKFNATNAFGECYLFSPNYIGSGGASNITQVLRIDNKDYLTGALVADSDINVKDVMTGVWQNITTETGSHSFYYNSSQQLYIESEATGYARSTKSWTTRLYSHDTLWMLMYPGTTPAAGNVTLHVVIFDGTSLNPMPNAQVRLSDGQTKTTTGAGVASFNVSATKSYQIVASYTGYQSATRTLTTGAGGTSQDTYLTLNRITVTTAPTLPPGVTAVVTLDTRTNAQKDQAMMDQVREYGSLLIPAACIMTLLYIFGYKP